MDINMPALQGDEIIRDFRKNKFKKNVRLILHSSLSPDELSSRAKKCKADGFIQKTNDKRLFIRQIKRFLDDPTEMKKSSNNDKSSHILIVSDKPFLTATVKIITSDYPYVELTQISDDAEAARLLKTQAGIGIVIIELPDDKPTLYSKTLTHLLRVNHAIPAILIGKDESIVNIKRRRNTVFLSSNPLLRSKLRDAVLSFLADLNQTGS